MALYREIGTQRKFTTIRNQHGQNRRGVKGGAEGPLIYISDYFICINDSRVLHYFYREYYISRIGQFCAGAQTGALRPSMLLLPTDVK